METQLMRKLALALFAVLSFAAAHTALADQQKPAAGGFSESKEMQATVTAIDLKTRMVTLKDTDGNETTIHVDKRARNLPQVKVGDVVKIAYLQSVAWKVNTSGKAAATKAEAAAVRAEPGEKPGGAAGQRITFTATIEAIDLDNGTVTLKGPEGESHTIKARNPANLKKVKVGDLVDITYTQAVAIKVEPAPM
jgi:Cu/Ag efflux protein CusF